MKNVKETQNTALKTMFNTLYTSVYKSEDTALLLKNYETQKKSYDTLLKSKQQEEYFVLARCLISATRSLIYAQNTQNAISTAKVELERLAPIFYEPKMLTKTDFTNIIESGIKNLTSAQNENIVDEVLFVYMSTLSVYKNLMA